MKILFVASECVPFCKTGGLADVIGALPKELRKGRHDVRIILPKYKTIRGQEFDIKETGERVTVPMGDRREVGEIRAAKGHRGLKVYFVHHDGFFGRSGLYRTSAGDYTDNGERFAFFSRAALEACKAMEFRPDIIHVHDWQTGLVPVFLKTIYKNDAFFQHTASVFTIHNMAYQGIFTKALMAVMGIGWEEFTLQKLEFYDQMNYLKAGINYADLLTTVSPTYAREIQSSPEFGQGLDVTLRDRSKDLSGILNGLDTEEWNPSEDTFLAEPFDASCLVRRRACKADLQKSLNLPVSADVPVLGMVARLDWQKGVDLLGQVLPELLKKNAQVIVLGQGDIKLQALLERTEQEYPNSFRIRSDFNEPLAHRIYGGSDLFLMPSRFEPCGLGQLIAMRYGAIPVVANTGGLRDTVKPVTREGGTGFLFQPGSAPAFLGALQEALHYWTDKAFWETLQRRAMSADFSWSVSAQSYLSLYRRALGRESRAQLSQKPS